jgi:DNA-binding CsgD family transcriptional regulator
LEARFDEAAAAHLEARELFRETGDLSWTMITLTGLGHVYHRQGNLSGALTCANEAVAIARQVGNTMGVATALIVAAMVATDRGEFAAGARHWAESLAISAEFRDWRATGQIAAGVAVIAVACGEHEQAARLFGASDAVRTTIGGGTISTLRDWYLPRLEEARETLGSAAFASAWDSGQTLSAQAAALETAAVAERLQLAAPPGHVEGGGHSSAQRAQFGLSPRELDVLRLLVAGQTDREIGATLFISPRTAQGHVAHLFDKLGVSTRTAAVTVALQHALVGPELAE